MRIGGGHSLAQLRQVKSPAGKAPNVGEGWLEPRTREGSVLGPLWLSCDPGRRVM